jgi:hypothetical protein
MTTLAIVIALILLLRWLGFAEPLAALIAAIAALLFAGLTIDKTALFAAATAPRIFDYVTLGIPLITVATALLGGLVPDTQQPRRPLGWSAAGDIRYFGIYLAICLLAAAQFQNSIFQIVSSTILFAILLFAVALVANVVVSGRNAFSAQKLFGSLAILVFLLVPTAVPILFGLFTPTEAICIVFLPTSILLRVGFDLANQRGFSGILEDMIRGATDGAWILLTFFGATLVIYGLRLQGPLASVDWLQSFPPAQFLAIYAAFTILCCSALGTTLGFLIAYAFFFPPFREAGLQSETIALIAVLCLLASLAKPELGLKLESRRSWREISPGQFAGFAACALLTVVLAFFVAPARF